jgi:hypothetical protein
MDDHESRDREFDAMTARMLHREAQRRAAQEINTTSGPGLENVLAHISAEVTAEAAALRGKPTGNATAPEVIKTTPSRTLPPPSKK